ncbi:MAG: hypothetical protein P4L46_25810 [Fimbriimonas sp.]|nr:hypothetical protein [Fimbriimonas sp.]
MVPTDIKLVIVLVVVAFLGVSIAGFFTFFRFLEIERQKAKRFRAFRTRTADKVNNKPTNRP